MDPRAAFLQQENDDNQKGFRNKSIGMHNLRAKLREQLKGYSHVRGFPLDPDTKSSDAADRRTDSLTARRDSIRRRHSSVTRQGRYDAEADAEQPKYRPRRVQKKDSLIVPRLLWFSVYLTLCFMAYKGMQFFSGETSVKLCQSCSSSCGVLDEEFTVPVDSLGDLPFGTVFPYKSSLQCRANVCVPGHVADPKALCRVVADEALLYHTRRLLAADEDTEISNERFLEYFRRRALREEGLAGALSPNPQPEPKPTNPPKPTDQPRPTNPGGEQQPKPVPGNIPQQTQQPQPQPQPRGEPQQTQQPIPENRPQQTTAATPVPAQTQQPKTTPPTPSATPPQAATPPGPPNQQLSNGGYWRDPAAQWTSLAAFPPSAYAGDGSGCSTLVYSPQDGDGYANLTTSYFMGITDVENFAQCCSLCNYESNCMGWTRVAGGDASVRNCYLKKSLELDSNPNAMSYNWQPPASPWPSNLELRYTGGVPIMFESGTKGRPYPDKVYGCPYPPAADGTCTAPAGCNCGGGTCYGACKAPNARSSTTQT